MKEIVERLKKKRDLETAKSIVESAGYSVDRNLNEGYKWHEETEEEYAFFSDNSSKKGKYGQIWYDSSRGYVADIINSRGGYDGSGETIKRKSGFKTESEAKAWIEKWFEENTPPIRESAGEYLNVEYIYNGDEVSNYRGHIKVLTTDKDVAIKAAKKYLDSAYPEKEARHFAISNDDYVNAEIINSDGTKGKSKDLDEAEDESVDHAAAMRNNRIYQELDDICTEHGYKVVEAYINKHGSPIINIRLNNSSPFYKYSPDIYFYHKKFGSVTDTFEIQTTSYGALGLNEYFDYKTSINNAYDMVKKLSEVDYYGLYVYEE